MFLHGVKPAWEDPVNAKGSEFKVDLGQLRENDKVQEIWEKVVFDIVSGNLPQVKEGVVGVRLVQKAKGGALSSFRLELWLSGDEEKSAANEEIRKYLETQIIGDVLKDTVSSGSSIQWQRHKG